MEICQKKIKDIEPEFLNLCERIAFGARLIWRASERGDAAEVARLTPHLITLEERAEAIWLAIQELDPGHLFHERPQDGI